MSAVKWAFVMSWGPNVIATLLTFVLAAYLGKENYGLVGIALLYITFAKIFLEGGFDAAIVQRQNLEPEHLDAVFWLTMSMSVGLMVLTWICSPFLARFYDLPELQRVLNLESFILLFQGLTVVQQSLLEKQLDFKSLAIRSNVSTLLGGLLGLGLAIKGYGVYALVWEDLGAAVVRVVLLWRLGHWRPRLRFSFKHIKDLASFSLLVMLAQVGTFVQRRSDALLVGAFFGAAAVGIYQMADQLINLVIEMTIRPLIIVVLPHFSRLQSNIPELRKSVLNCLRTSAMATVPVLAILAGCAYLICGALSALKNDWMPAIHVIQVLSIVGAARAITLLTGPLMQSLNRPRPFMVLSWGLAILNTVAFCIAGWWLGSYENIEIQAVGVAAMRAAVFCVIYTPICMYIVMKICDISVTQIVKSCVPAILSSGLVFGIGIMVSRVLHWSELSRHWPGKLWVTRLIELAIGGGVTTLVAVSLMILVDPTVKKFLLSRIVGKKAKPRIVEEQPEIYIGDLQKPASETVA